MSLRIGMQAAVAGSGGAPLPEPRAISLPGFDESALMEDVWSAAEVSAGGLDAVSMGISLVTDSASEYIFAQTADTTVGLLELFRTGSAGGGYSLAVRTGGISRRTRPVLGIGAAGGIERVGASFGGGTSNPDLWLNGVMSTSSASLSNTAGTLLRDIALGRRGTTFSEFVWWAWWGIRATLTNTQQVTINTLITDLDVAGLVAYLKAISPTECWLFWPDETTNVASPLPDKCGNYPPLQLVNLAPEDLVAVPT